ncbi:MAG: phospho-N-acetylmuramoyl-pentapeptide-transferase [Oscillospiraceae bacterium]|nr:phospho-N-acetylmuramoyl-pentapeptide-transferase [Oscillospiraceae bacterium]
MLSELLKDIMDPYLLGAVAAFVLSLLGLIFGRRFLPKDQGREFAVNGEKSKGKARGAGIILMLALIVAAILFVPLSLEYVIYLVAIFFEMLSGYLDDASEKPWGELVKGIIDLVIAVAVSVTIYMYHGSTIQMPSMGLTYTIPAALYIFLGVVMIWTSINVTNCADGVDGLCTCLTLTTLGTAFLVLQYVEQNEMRMLVWLCEFVLIAYLWFNCSPSTMLMGDAGSRALGLLIAMAFMVSGMPFLFIPGTLVLLIDGGLGLVKLTVRRVTKSTTFMDRVRTPIHDHMRRKYEWSDTQVVTRFTLVQVLQSVGIILLLSYYLTNKA